MTQDAETLLAKLVLQVTILTSELQQLRSIVSGSPSFAEGWASPKDAAVALKKKA